MNMKKTAIALGLVALSKQGNPINYQQQIQQPIGYQVQQPIGYQVPQPIGVGVGVAGVPGVPGVPMYNNGFYGGYGYFPGYGGPWGYGWDDWGYDGGRRRHRSHSRRRSHSGNRRNYYRIYTNSTSS